MICHPIRRHYRHAWDREHALDGVLAQELEEVRRFDLPQLASCSPGVRRSKSASRASPCRYNSRGVAFALVALLGYALL